MKAGKRIALMLALMLAALAGGAASAEGVIVAASRLNMRAEASASSKALCIVEKGDELSFVSENGDWYQVKYGGKSGYVMRSYVRMDMNEAEADVSANMTAMTAEGRTTERVNLRALPMTGSELLRVIPKNGGVKISGQCGLWYRVTYGGKTGFIMAQYVHLTESAPAPEQPDDVPEADDGSYAEAALGVATARVNMRKSPTTASSVVRVIPNGGTVTVTGEMNGWYCVVSGGQTGYISKEYLRLQQLPGGDTDEDAGDTVAPVNPTDISATWSGTLTARVNLRQEASTGSAVLRVLNKNTQVQVAGWSEGFYLILHDGEIGYISADYVKTDCEADPAETIYPAVREGVTLVTVNLRAAPEGAILHTVQMDEPVLLLGERGGWHKVACHGEIGYVSKEYVSEKLEPGQTPETGGEGVKAYVTANSLNLRKGPGTGYGVVKVLTYGAEVTYYSLTDGWYHVLAGEDSGYVSAKYISEQQPEDAEDGGAVIGAVILSDWFKGEIADVFARGDVATVTDVKTGLSFKAKRTGGYHHADAQPLTTDDTEIMHKAYGYQWQWTRRPIWVTVDGKTYAASMNGMPHGESDSMPENGFDGCFCIHFLNSKTHGSDRVDSAHQSCVQEAYKAG